MLVQDQSETIQFLSAPAAYGHAGPVDVIETHISFVFLVGARAYKMKRAVHLPYADFSTPAIRLAACEKELTLNRRTTPALYRRVRRITRGADGLCFDGRGELVDAVVEMVRFDQEGLLDRMAMRGALSAPLISDLSDTIASAHDRAERIDGQGGAANIAGVLDINRAGFAESGVFSDAEISRIDRAFQEALADHANLLDRRADAGAIRRCHGDLHLRNVCLFNGRPRLFDCIDFNDQLATVDLLYDLAFMVMDLWHRRLPDLANLLTNRYLDRTGQEDGFPLLPMFTALRAAVRAHVTATQSTTCAERDAPALRQAARAYYDLSLDLLHPIPPRLIAIGGLSGSGKSTVASALAAEIGSPPGARVIESDRVRKAMFGVDPDTRLPQQAYAPEVSERVYATMADRAEALIAAGSCVIVDAVYDQPARRAAVAEAARAAQVPFLGIWLQADPTLLEHRVTDRCPGASDATAEVLRGQLARDPGPMEWETVSTATPLKVTCAAILRLATSDEN